MTEAADVPTIVYQYGFHNPLNFTGWYEVYVVSDGTAASPRNFDSLAQFIVEHLSRPDNINKKAVAHNRTPAEFTEAQVVRLESLLSEHNGKLLGFAEQVTTSK